MPPTVEHVADFEWRGVGEASEVVIHAPDARTAAWALERALPVALLPGVVSPLYAVAVPGSVYGSVVASGSHAAPDLASVPARGLLLVADAAIGELGVPPEEVGRLVSRDLSDVRPPALSEAGARGLCGRGALASAEVGLIEEEDLELLDPAPDADADALLRRALSAGLREWDLLGEAHACGVGEIFEAEDAESLGLSSEALVLVASVGAGDLGRIVLSGHRKRILSRVLYGDLEAEEDLPAAPAGTEEASDLLAAVGAAANFADGRAALLVYALRRVLRDVAGGLRLIAAWRVGGVEESGGAFVHRRGIATAAEGDVALSGGTVVVGTGKMCGSVPPFAAPEVDGSHPWEDAGLLERWADLHPPEGNS
ncbi:MAG TPA: hypothetical protein VK869_01785 [Rubrobacteraceae bacterium]|nr:hypothetical protein [Rubrobacteraceae bacterium]